MSRRSKAISKKLSTTLARWHQTNPNISSRQSLTKPACFGVTDTLAEMLDS
jgi:hypothetical protein